MNGAIRWLLDRGHSLVLGVLAFIALAVSVGAVVTEWLHQSHAWSQYVPSGILILLSTYVLVFLFEYHGRPTALFPLVERLIKFERLGLSEMYVNRDDPGQNAATACG